MLARYCLGEIAGKEEPPNSLDDASDNLDDRFNDLVDASDDLSHSPNNLIHSPNNPSHWLSNPNHWLNNPRHWLNNPSHASKRSGQTSARLISDYGSASYVLWLMASWNSALRHSETLSLQTLFLLRLRLAAVLLVRYFLSSP